MKNEFINDEFFAKLKMNALKAEKALNGFFGGTHKTNKKGQSIEFKDYQDYNLGDDLRKIDWNLYSRFEKYYIKQLDDERRMNVEIYIDCSLSMKNDSNKRDYALALAIAIGFLGINNSDIVSFFLIYNNKINKSYTKINSKNYFYKIISQLVDIDFKGEAAISNAILNNQSFNTKKSGISIVISDFLTENDYQKGINFLGYNGRRPLVIQVLSPEEIMPNYLGRMNLIDVESLDIEDQKNLQIKLSLKSYKAYQKALDNIRENLKNASIKAGGRFISVSCQENLEKVLFEKLILPEKSK